MIMIYRVKRYKYSGVELLEYIMVFVVCITVLGEWDLGNTDRFPGASMYYRFGCVSFWGLRTFR